MRDWSDIIFEVKYKSKFLHCSPRLKENLSKDINEIFSVIKNIKWKSDFTFTDDKGKKYMHQTGYNKAFHYVFKKLGWETYPKLNEKPNLIGDFGKDLIFGEIQFGNSSTLYRDFYKFQFGLQNGLLSIAILIVPTKPDKFFPTRPRSVLNMAEYKLALRYFTILPISVPTLIIGLEPN